MYQKAQTQKHAARQTPVPSHALSVTGNGFGFRILNTPARKSDGRDAPHRIRDHARGSLDPVGLVAGMPRPGSSEESMPLTVAETGRFGRDPERGGAGGETTCDETRSRSKVPFAAVCVGALVVVFVVAIVTGGVGSSGVDFAVRASRVEVRHTVTNVGGHRGEAPSGGQSAGEARLGHAVMMASDADRKRDRKRDDNDQSDTSSSATVPKLGQERYCGDAFSTPNNVGPLDATRISVTAQGVLKYADAVYVICTDMCETLIIPQELAEKTTLVNGYTLDACAGLGDETKHWEKASRAHSAAMSDAFANEDIKYVSGLSQIPTLFTDPL